MDTEYLPYVILVEDDPAFRAVLGQFLGEVGYNVVAISDASEAINFYDRERTSIGLIITDISTSRANDGMNLIRHVNERDSLMPIVAISGNASAQLTQELAKLDIGFFHKPFDLEALYRFIERRAQRHLQEPRRLINMVRRGGGLGNTALPAFLSNMCNVPDPAKDRCIIAVTGLSHMNYIMKSKDALFSNKETVLLNLCREGHHMIKKINRDNWDKPVTIIGSLHILAYEHKIERVGKIAFFGGAAMLPPNHPARVRLEDKLYREESMLQAA